MSSTLLHSIKLETTPWAQDHSQYELIEPVDGLKLWLKREGFQSSGSIKEKPAYFMLRAHELAGRAGPGARVIVPSSGNTVLGAAVLCAKTDRICVAVIDPRTSAATRNSLKVFGAELVEVDTADSSGNFLEARWARAQQLAEECPHSVVLDQYGDPANPFAHEVTTANELATKFPRLDAVFIGVGTGGTITGTARGLRKLGRASKIIGVTPRGATVFGGPPGQLRIPGIGGSFVPGNLDKSAIDEVAWVSEAESVAVCRWMPSNAGLLVGGSTGSVIAAAIHRHKQRPQSPNEIWVAICADNGDKYLPTIFNDEWVRENFGADPIKIGEASELTI